MFTGIDGGIVEMAVYGSARFATVPTSVPQSQLGWCSAVDGMAANNAPPLMCSSLRFEHSTANGQDNDVLILTRDDGMAKTPSYFVFESGVFGKTGMYRTIGSNFGLLSISGSAAPEPATWMTLIAGFALIGFSLRQKNGLLGPVRATAGNNFTLDHTTQGEYHA
jgi:hypothetical protein